MLLSWTWRFNGIEKYVEKNLKLGVFKNHIYSAFKGEVQQHYYDKQCSPESWSSLLTSPLAENSGGLGAYQVLQQSVEKDETITECLVVFLMFQH